MPLIINSLKDGHKKTDRHKHIPMHEQKWFQETRHTWSKATHAWFKKPIMYIYDSYWVLIENFWGTSITLKVITKFNLLQNLLNLKPLNFQLYSIFLWCIHLNYFYRCIYYNTIVCKVIGNVWISPHVMHFCHHNLSKVNLTSWQFNTYLKTDVHN